MNYTFKIQDAVNYGVDEAVMLSNFQYWLTKNKANNKHQLDGKTWTYNSIDAFSKLFPFWTPAQIRRILKSLLDQKVIIKSKHNKHAYDKTNWYALTDETPLLLICQNQPIDMSKPANGYVETSKPIPDSKQQIVNTDITTDPNLNLEAWSEFVLHRKTMKPPLTKLAEKKLIKKLSALSLDDQVACIDESIENGWKGLFPRKGTFNARGSESTFDKLTGAARQNADLLERVKRRSSRKL